MRVLYLSYEVNRNAIHPNLFFILYFVLLNIYVLYTAMTMLSQNLFFSLKKKVLTLMKLIKLYNNLYSLFIKLSRFNHISLTCLNH